MEKWQELYRQKLGSAEDAAKLVQTGDTIVAPLSNGQPLALINALAQRIRDGNLTDLTYVSGVDVRWFDLYHPDLEGKVTIDTGFVASATRHGVGQGLFTYTPCRLGETVDMISRCREGQGVSAMVVSPIDKHGFFSTGCNVDWGWEAAKINNPHAIIAEVNENMPRTYGNNQLHVSEISAIIKNTIPLVELPFIPTGERDEKIGGFIADMIEDGSCLQISIGSMPDSLARFLTEKKDLGIHFEMLTDSMVDLYNAGVVTCRKKNFMPYEWICGDRIRRGQS